MPDLYWDQVGDLFDPDRMGALPDLSGPDTTVRDWQAVLDLVTTSGWQWHFEIDGAARPLPTAASIFARPGNDEYAELRAWPAPGVLTIFRLWQESEVTFDVDLHELQGQQGVDTLCALLRAIGSRLGKPVLMTPEGGSQQQAVLGYDPAHGKVTLFPAR
jgi:hypothetical protein